MSPTLEVVSTAYDLWHDATSVDGHLGVTCWISHGPRAADPAFDPRPGDWVLVGDDEEEEPLPARVVGRDRDRVTVQVAIADITAVASRARSPEGGRVVPGGCAVAEAHDIAVDFMDMTNDGRLWVRAADVHDGFEPAAGRCAVVGDDDADPRAARIVEISDDGLIHLEVLPGPLEAHGEALARP
jgi:hypothetical protein